MIPFSKMNGLGNKIIIADMRDESSHFTKKAAIALANHDETAFDQIMVLYKAKSKNTDFYIEILNKDGSMANACGNGTRCVVEWLYQNNKNTTFIFEIANQIITARRLENGLISVDMGEPHIHWQDIPIAYAIEDTNHANISAGPLKDACLVSMGNPHAIYFIDEELASFPLEIYGAMLEKDVIFPDGCNISIAKILSEEEICLRTWERGAGLTKACGTAACASLVAAVRRGLTKKHAKVHLPGGMLSIAWEDNNHIIMTGATEFEFHGMVDPIYGKYQILGKYLMHGKYQRNNA